MRPSTGDIVKGLLTLAEEIDSDDDRKKLEAAAGVLASRENGDTYGPFESKVTAIGNTYYVAIGEAARALELAPRQRIKVTIEKL